jgi:hypothetical protein
MYEFEWMGYTYRYDVDLAGSVIRYSIERQSHQVLTMNKPREFRTIWEQTNASSPYYAAKAHNEKRQLG